MNDEVLQTDWAVRPSQAGLDVAVARSWESDREGAAARVALPGLDSPQDSEGREAVRGTGLGPLALYLQEIRQIPLLPVAEEIALARALQESRQARAELAHTDIGPVRSRELSGLVGRGEAARQQLTEANLRLVVSIARKYLGRGLPLLDLIQEGNLGLARAVEKYDYRLGYRFSTYATWWIRQALHQALADQGRTIRLPAQVGDQITALARTRRRLEQELGREATVDEVAHALAVTPQKVSTIAQVAEPPLSLEAPVGETGESRLSDLIADTAAPTPLEVTTLGLLRDQVEKVLGSLPERQRRVVELRFGLIDGRDHTLEEVSRELGLTRERVRQLEGKALQKLRSPHMGAPLRDYY